MFLKLARSLVVVFFSNDEKNDQESSAKVPTLKEVVKRQFLSVGKN